MLNFLLASMYVPMTIPQAGSISYVGRMASLLSFLCKNEWVYDLMLKSKLPNAELSNDMSSMSTRQIVELASFRNDE
jgi:hypothetical protein